MCQQKTIIISPLNVIIEQQLACLGSEAVRVRSPGLNIDKDQAVDDDDDADDSDDRYDGKVLYPSSLEKGDFNFLVGHPEDFLCDSAMDLMRTAKWQTDVNTIVVDEAHCVVHWSSNFRPKYREIDQLRAIFQSATVVALTATASVKMRQEICRILNMTDPVIVTAEVDRVNMKYVAKQRPSFSHGVELSYTSVIVPLMKELKTLGSEFPKSVLYTNLQWCGSANEIGVKILGNGDLSLAGVPEIAQFHAPLSAKAKKDVAAKMASPNSHLRLLLATEAYGMGVDTPDIRRVIHAGPPCTLESYMQSTGQGGRDGLESEAILHFNNADLGKVTMMQDMHGFCQTENCRREYPCHHFGTSIAYTGPQDNCCDNCEMNCECEECTYHRDLANINIEDEPENLNDPYEQALIRNALMQIFHALNEGISSYLDPQMYTGLTVELANDIATNNLLFKDQSDLLQVTYSHLKPDHVKVIHQVILACSVSM